MFFCIFWQIANCQKRFENMLENENVILVCCCYVYNIYFFFLKEEEENFQNIFVYLDKRKHTPYIP
jgi:hypothetical protein